MSFTEILSGGYPEQLRKRAVKLQKRHRQQSAITETTLSLRRKIAEEPGGLIGILSKPLPNMQKLEDKLHAAQIHLPAKVFLLRGVLVVLLTAGIGTMLHMPFYIGFCLGMFLGLFVPLKYVNFRINKNLKAFLNLFPDAIDLIVRGLRSGLPATESMKMVGKEVPDPVGDVFRRITDTMELGVPLETALQEVAKSLNSTEFNFFCTSIVLQRETGGNLAEILSNLSTVLRKRYMMKMKIKAMTSEARASAWIVGSLPFLVAIAVSVLSPGYLNLLFTDYRGNQALASAIFLLAFGVWMMGRMAKFKL